jgi:hypothetical protein
MQTSEAVNHVLAWINQAETWAYQVEGSYANGGRASELQWMKNTLLTAPNETSTQQLLEHWVGTGALPSDLLTSKS